MPIYDRPIDNYGFQPLTTASSTENMSMGGALVDVGLGMGIESLGMGLMGVKGAFGKPLAGFIPGVVSEGVNFASGGARSNTLDVLRKSLDNKRMGANLVAMNNPVVTTSGGSRLGGLIHGNTNITSKVVMPKNKAAVAAMGFSELLAEIGGNKAYSRDKTISGLASRYGLGLGLKALGSAWIFTDMFSMGFSMANSAIQGIESFSYERRARIQSEGGLSADLGEGFADTRASFTQRQRAMQAIHNSQMNTRAAMGNEATFMHV